MRRDKLKRELPLYIMLIPAVVLVFIFSYGSMAGIVIAFEKFKPALGLFGKTAMGGVQEFRNPLCHGPNMLPIIRNTIVIALGKMLGGIIVPVLFALMLNEVGHTRSKRLFQTMVYLPNFLSWVILSGILLDVLSPSGGVVNTLLGVFGVEPIFFLGNAKVFPGTMIVTEIWRSFGFGSVIYLAAITGIDPALYEAAKIDGANRLKQTWHVTLPGMTSIIILMTVLSLGNILNGGFDQIYNMYSPVVYSTGDILDTFCLPVGHSAGAIFAFDRGRPVQVRRVARLHRDLVLSGRQVCRIQSLLVEDRKMTMENPVLRRRQSGSRIKDSTSRKVFLVINTLFMLLISLICIAPFINLLAISFSNKVAVAAGEVTFFPIGFTTVAYDFITNTSKFTDSLFISLQRTLLGVPFNLLLIILTAYPLSKSKEDFRARGLFSWFFVITILFNAGLIPTYMVVKTTGLINSIWSLILPGALPVFQHARGHELHARPAEGTGRSCLYRWREPFPYALACYPARLCADHCDSHAVFVRRSLETAGLTA